MKLSETLKIGEVQKLCFYINLGSIKKFCENWKSVKL